MRYTVDKLADYEDELHQLKSTQTAHAIHSAATASEPTLPRSQSVDGTATTEATAAAGRFANLLGRKQSASSQPAPTVSRRESDLAAALARERELRQAAEGKLSEMNTEVEELSVTLFQQANEMVAAERKARARLEERVEILERRDHDKRKRLERLEGAIKRVEKVRDVLER